MPTLADTEPNALAQPAKDIVNLDELLTSLMQAIAPSPEFEGKECDEGEGWAYGFVEGMRLRWNYWQPLLETEQGKAWYHPIALLGEDHFGPDQDDLTVPRSSAQRSPSRFQMPCWPCMHIGCRYVRRFISVMWREPCSPRSVETIRAPVAAARSSRSAAVQPSTCTDTKVVPAGIAACLGNAWAFRLTLQGWLLPLGFVSYGAAMCPLQKVRFM